MYFTDGFMILKMSAKDFLHEITQIAGLHIRFEDILVVVGCDRPWRRILRSQDKVLG